MGKGPEQVFLQGVHTDKRKDERKKMPEMKNTLDGDYTLQKKGLVN